MSLSKLIGPKKDESQAKRERRKEARPGELLDAALDLLMAELLEARATARANKDFATADLLRERLAAAGITIEDTPNGAHWSFNGR